jgi:hypothetical protein
MTGLDHESPPPPELKQRVMSTLRERQLLRGRFFGRTWVRQAAAIVLFASGFWMARLTAQTEPDGPRWLLLLYEDSSFAPRAALPDLVAEYSRWADSLRSRGELVAGEELDPRKTVVSRELEAVSETGSLGEIAGLFIVTAESETGAMAIARSCPHLRHGGRMVLRPIRPT